VDADGFLWQSILQVALRAEAKQVEREVAAQIERARSAGMQPTHLMTDMGSSNANGYRPFAIVHRMDFGRPRS
jgi:hypothetical protein